MADPTIAESNTISREGSLRSPSRGRSRSPLVAMRPPYHLWMLDIFNKRCPLIRLRRFRNEVKLKHRIYVPTEEAYDIVMDHIQDLCGHMRYSVSLQMLMDIAKIVDQLKCQEWMGSSSQRWMDELWGQERWRWSRGQRAMGWMFVAHVFEDSHKYREASRKLIMGWKNRSLAVERPLDTLIIRKKPDVRSSK
ncbi:hypothetical protein F5Y08DRAFT_310439 [Xylaria arbuscula]|nr:hypothetical protein F5Y08DRAFT_310439 [Xylaria arbuscula]